MSNKHLKDIPAKYALVLPHNRKLNKALKLLDKHHLNVSLGIDSIWSTQDIELFKEGVRGWVIRDGIKTSRLDKTAYQLHTYYQLAKQLALPNIEWIPEFMVEMLRMFTTFTINRSLAYSNELYSDWAWSSEFFIRERIKDSINKLDRMTKIYKDLKASYLALCQTNNSSANTVEPQ